MFGSGSRIMSDSWISWNPRIDEPSNPKPSVKTILAQLVRRDREVLGHAGQVANRTSTISMPSSLTSFSTSAGVRLITVSS